MVLFSPALLPKNELLSAVFLKPVPLPKNALKLPETFVVPAELPNEELAMPLSLS